MLDGVDLRRPEADLPLMLHHDPRGKHLHEERGGPGWRSRLQHARTSHIVRRGSHLAPARRNRTPQDRDPQGAGEGDHARDLPRIRPCEYGFLAGFTLRHPSSESEQPTDGRVSETSMPYDPSSTSVGLVYSPIATTGRVVVRCTSVRSLASQSTTVAPA